MLNPETVPFTYKGIEAHSRVLAGGGTEVIFAPLWVLMWVCWEHFETAAVCRFLLPSSITYSTEI